MKQTTFEEFTELATRGTFVPVCREIMADLLTPVSAFLTLTMLLSTPGCSATPLASMLRPPDVKTIATRSPSLKRYGSRSALIGIACPAGRTRRATLPCTASREVK